MTDTELVAMLRSCDWPDAADRIEALAKEVAELLTDATLIGELTDSLGTVRDALRQAETDAMTATRRAERAEAEVERLNKRRCETCEHGFYGDCLRAVQTHNSALDEWREYVTCETFGGGCQAWEEKHG